MSGQSSDRPEPRKSGIHDADLDGLAIHRPTPGPATASGGRRRFWLILTVLLVVAGLMWSSSWMQTDQKVEVVPVVRLPSSSGAGLAATGYVVAQRQASIASKGTGRLIYFGVNVGDRVKEGQLIARIEHDDMDALLRQALARLGVARAQLGAAKPELEEATLSFERVKTLLEKSFVTRSEYDMASARLRRAAAAVKSAEAAVTAAEAERQNATVQLENTSIRAPFDGVIVKKLAEIGEVVSPFTATVRSGGSVVNMVDPLSVTVDAEVSEAMIHLVRAGQPAEIQLDSVPGHRYQGEVLQIMPIADRAKGTVLTRIRFRDLDDRVRPELSAKVTFGPVPGTAAEKGEDWGVPSTAVVTREGQTVVLVVRAGIVAEAVVQAGTAVAGMVPVHGPLSQTDEVIVAPAESLRSGSAVSVVRRGP